MKKETFRSIFYAMAEDYKSMLLVIGSSTGGDFDGLRRKIRPRYDS